MIERDISNDTMMKVRIIAMNFFSLLLVLACMLLMSCNIDLETSDNGKLDGYWHIERIDSLENGNSLDYSDRLMFWAIQLRFLEVRDRDNHLGAYLLRFDHTGDSLLLSNPHLSDKNSGDPVVEDVEVLRPYGINELNERFKVENLSGNKMILKNRFLRLNFKKL